MVHEKESEKRLLAQGNAKAFVGYQYTLTRLFVIVRTKVELEFTSHLYFAISYLILQ